VKKLRKKKRANAAHQIQLLRNVNAKVAKMARAVVVQKGSANANAVFLMPNVKVDLQSKINYRV